jgi:GDP-D-mannose dehydratase
MWGSAMRCQGILLNHHSRYRKSMSVTLNIPDSVVQGLRLPEG